ncbi:MAG: hypothetical protein ACLU9S_04060 [Oscillospiraceae bacterium]
MKKPSRETKVPMASSTVGEPAGGYLGHDPGGYTGEVPQRKAPEQPEELHQAAAPQGQAAAGKLEIPA